MEHPAIAAMINYSFGLKELHPALGVPHEDLRSKLESLSVQTFVYALTMVSNQLCWSTPVQEFSHSEYADDWQQLYNMFNQWSKKPDHITDWHNKSQRTLV